MYLTGDRAARTGTGSFDHRGRADQQVKLRGQLVELTDVAANVCRFSGVAEAVAVVHSAGGTPLYNLHRRTKMLLPNPTAGNFPPVITVGASSSLPPSKPKA